MSNMLPAFLVASVLSLTFSASFCFVLPFPPERKAFTEHAVHVRCCHAELAMSALGLLFI